jgi:hypothetical protein
MEGIIEGEVLEEGILEGRGIIVESGNRERDDR